MSFDAKRMLKFEHNVGEKEKKIRLYTGAALVIISIFMGKILLLLLGLIAIGTGYSGWCPAYSGLDKSTVEAATSTKAESEKKETPKAEKEKAPAKPKAKSTAKKPAAKKTAAKKSE